MRPAGAQWARYGTKYRVEGRLISLDGRNPLVTIVWIVDGEIVPRFVTTSVVQWCQTRRV